MLGAVILAAGKSERFGANKLLMPWQGKKMIEVILEIVTAMGFEEVVLVYGDEIVEKMAQKFQVKAIHNPSRDLGLSESVRYGINALSEEVEGIMFFLGDQPNLEKEILLELMAIFSEAPEKIIVPTCGGKPGNPVIFPQKYRKNLTELEGDQGGKQIIRGLKDGVVYHPVKAGDFCLDIDTPEDYQDFLRKKMSEKV